MVELDQHQFIAAVSSTMIIDKFAGKYKFLSNLYPCKIKVKIPLFIGDNRIWPSAEHLYQALKCELYFNDDNVPSAEQIKKLKSPLKAMAIGNKVNVYSSWKEEKIEFMQRIVELKFSQNKLLAKKLLATGSALLIYNNTYGDKFWGKCKGTGKNYLGLILMKVRSKLKKEMK